MNLYHFLRRVLPRFMSRDITWLIAEGRVTVNAEPGDIRTILRTGDYVIVNTSSLKERKPKQRTVKTLEILYRDDSVLCVNKPAGIPVIPDRRPTISTAVEICRKMLAPEGINPNPVHRLDKQTSGVLMLALRKKSVQPLGELFSQRRIHKTYLAFVRGVPRPPEAVVDAPVGPDSRKMTRMVVNMENGKPAVTNYSTRTTWPGYAFLEIRPETGRTHQIRVHLAHIKHPILCDPVYGGGETFHLSTLKPQYRIGRGKRERPILNRLALHAWKLAFTSPGTNERVEVEAPLPKDLSILKQKLDKFA